jgi:hypothetical protein
MDTTLPAIYAVDTAFLNGANQAINF